MTRIDGPVDFSWGGDSPSPAIANNDFSVRWNGSITTPVEGNCQFEGQEHLFQTVSDDGVKLYVNGDQIIERWDDHPPTTDRGSIELRGGEEYNIALEYYERGGGATIQLMWATPYILPDGGEGGGEGGGKENAELVLIPASSLKPPATETVNKLVYLHGDHLGSVSVVTSESGKILSESEYDPWGKTLPAASGNAPVTETKRNYTGQLLDDTGLVYMHARYYDPNLGRFVSPDSIVPGMESAKSGAGGTVGAYQNHKLTVDFHESGFVSSLQGENKLVLEKGFWFQLSNQDRRGVNDPWGPMNPQALNRYSYVMNNPLRYTDPSGHYLLTANYKYTSSKVPRGYTLTLSRNEFKEFIGAVRNGKGPVLGFIAGLLGGGAAVSTPIPLLTFILGFLAASVPIWLDPAYNDYVNALQQLYDNGGTIEISCDPGLALTTGDSCAMLPVAPDFASTIEEDHHMAYRTGCTDPLCFKLPIRLEPPTNSGGGSGGAD